jgi:hypothetical protein
MKAVVVYDSQFGNTERLARAIAEQLSAEEPAPVLAANATSERDLAGSNPTAKKKASVHVPRDKGCFRIRISPTIQPIMTTPASNEAGPPGAGGAA